MLNQSRSHMIAIAVSLFIAGASSLPAFAIETHHFDVQVDRPADAIRAFAAQADVHILAAGDNLKGKQLRAVTGELTTDDGLKLLLADSGLVAQYMGNRSIALVPPAPATAASAAERDTISAENEAEETGEAWRPFRLAQADASATGAKDEGKTELSEIVVTAQKREERALDVPMSISVLTADSIDRRGLVNAADYLRGVPGASQMEGQYGQSIVIRGMETSPAYQNLYSGTTVATYFGETPTTNTAGLAGGTNIDLKLVDVERVEVLRGPQGTAFGNSAMGGAVRTIPALPDLSAYEAKGSVRYSITEGAGGDNFSAQLIGNLPLIAEKFALRAVGYRYEDSGIYRNRAGSNPAFRDSVVTPYDVASLANDASDVGSTAVLGGRIAALFQASDNLSFTLSYLSQKAETDGRPWADSGTYEQTVLDIAPEHTSRGQRGGFHDTDVDIANLTASYGFGWGNLLATYSDVKSGTLEAYGYTSFGLDWPVSELSDNNHREHVGEIRVVSELGGPVDFILGLYAEQLKDSVLFDDLWQGGAGAVNFLGSSRFLGDYTNRRKLEQRAAFGELSWKPLERLKITGGARAYEYDRDYLLDTNGDFYGEQTLKEQTSASGATFRTNVSYKPAKDSLLYAGWSQGFRLGQIQAGLSAGVCDRNQDGLADGTNIAIASTRNVNSDDVDSYEIGGNLSLLDRRITISADVFRMNWSGMPVTVTPRSLSGAPDSCTLGYLANAGEAVSEGLEFQVSLKLSAPFSVDLGGSWLHARLTEDAPALNASKGNRLPGSPRFNANVSPQYEFSFGEHEAFIRADAIYVGSFFGDLAQSENLKSAGYVQLDATARLNIRNLSMDLFIRNLTNEDAFSFRGTLPGFSGEFSGSRLRPRTIGVQIGYTFR